MSFCFEDSLGDRDRSGFLCGVAPLDDYFQNKIVEQIDKRETAGYVLEDDDTGEIIGYYTLSNYAVVRDDFSNTIRKREKFVYPQVPATLLGRLAIQQEHQSGGFGTKLLGFALRRAVRMSRECGSRVVVVDTIDEKVRDWYRKRGFRNLKGDQLYVTIADIEETERKRIEARNAKRDEARAAKVAAAAAIPVAEGFPATPPPAAVPDPPG